MLGLDSPQGMDLFLSFGNGIGTSGDCQMPASAGVGGWPVFLLQKSLNGDYTVNGYLGGSADANLNVAEVINQFPVIGTFTQCELRIFTVALTLGSNTSIECLVSKNSFINSTPCSVSVTTVGFQSSGAVAMSFSTGDEIGVRVRATGGGGAGSPTFAKYMVHVHLTP